MPSGTQHPRRPPYAGLYLGIVLMLGCGLLGSITVQIWRQHRPVDSPVETASSGLRGRRKTSVGLGYGSDGTDEWASSDGVKKDKGVFDDTGTAAGVGTVTEKYLSSGDVPQDQKDLYRSLDISGEQRENSGCDPDPAQDSGRLERMRIPRLIHQNFLGGADKLDRESRAVRTHFRREWRFSCQTHNPGWRYMLWDREAAVQLLKTRYPWFLPTWLNYSTIVMQSDALRPFILHAFGGLYLDLDTECYRPVEPTLQCADLALMAEDPRLANNAQMASVVGHPLWPIVMAALVRNAAARISSPLHATGPWVITRAFRELANLSDSQPLPGRYRLPPVPNTDASTSNSTSRSNQTASVAVVYGPRQWFTPCSWNEKACHRTMSWATPLLRLEPGRAVKAAEQMLAGGDDGDGSAGGPKADETESMSGQKGAAFKPRMEAAASASLKLLRQLDVVGAHQFSGSWLGHDGSKAEHSKEWVTEALLSFFTQPEVFTELPRPTCQQWEGTTSAGMGQQGQRAELLDHSSSTEQRQQQDQLQDQQQQQSGEVSGWAGDSERTAARSAAACFAKHWLTTKSASSLSIHFGGHGSMSGSNHLSSSRLKLRKMIHRKLAAVGAGIGNEVSSDDEGSGHGGGEGGSRSSSGKGVKRGENGGAEVSNEGFSAPSPLTNTPSAASSYDNAYSGHPGGDVARSTVCTVMSVQSSWPHPLDLEMAFVRQVGCDVHVVTVPSNPTITAKSNPSGDKNSTPTTTIAAATTAGRLNSRTVQELDVGTSSAGRLFLHSTPSSQLLPDVRKDAAIASAPATSVFTNTAQDIANMAAGGNDNLDLVVLNCGSCAWDVLHDLYETGSRILDRVDALLVLDLPTLPYSQRAVLYEAYELLYQMHGFVGYVHHHGTKGSVRSYKVAPSNFDEGANTTDAHEWATFLPGGLSLGWMKRVRLA